MCVCVFVFEFRKVKLTAARLKTRFSQAHPPESTLATLAHSNVSPQQPSHMLACFICDAHARVSKIHQQMV